MTAFVDDEGNYLDYSGADVGISKQCANFYDFKIKGDVSVTLKIDNNSQNRKALGYYGVSQIDSPAFSKVPFNMVRDGNTISRGYIVIKDADEENLNVFYISGNTNWFQLFQFNLREVDFRDKYTVLSTDFDGRKAATSGIIFPLVDWFAKGSKRSSSYHVGYISPTPEDFAIFTEHHPALYLSTLVEEMGRYAGINLDGDLIDDGLFNKIVITNTGPEYYNPDEVIKRTYAKIQNGPFSSAGAGLYDYTLDPQLIRLQTIVEGSGQVETSTYKYFAPVTGTYRVDVDFWVNNVDTYSVEAWRNGALETVVFNQAINTRNKVGTVYINMVKGDYLQFYVNNTLAANYRLDYLGTYKTNVTIAIASKGTTSTPSLSTGTSAYYILPNQLTPDMKAIELIKFLANYFSCVVSYDEYANTIYLNKLSGFKKEDAVDWSDYFIDAKVKWDTRIAKKNYIQTEEGSEEDIIGYNKSHNVTYGGGTIETSFDSIEEREAFKIPFSGSWDEKNKSYKNVFLPYINFYDIELGESVAYSNVTNSGGLAKFTSTFNEPIEATDIFYVISASGVYTGYSTLSFSDTDTTNPALYIEYVAGDTGTIIKCKASAVSGPNRMLICDAGKSISDVGLTTLNIYRNGAISVSTPATMPICYFDKPNVLLPVDEYNESLAIDSENARSLTISERYYGPIKNILNNPTVEASFNLPLSEFQSFNFTSYVCLKTKDLTGYFIVQSIENYRDALTPVKVQLLYAD